MSGVLVRPALRSADRLRQAFQDFAAGFIDRVPNLIAAVGCLLVAIIAARMVRRAVEAALRRSSTETHLRVLAGKLTHLGVMAAGIVAALALVGVNLTAIVASVGFVAVAIAVGLQDIVGNAAAGIVLLLEHPCTAGDVIATKDAEGTVEEVRIQTTRLRAPDGQLVVVPNKLLTTSALTAAPLPAPPGGHVRSGFVAFGDFGGGSGQIRVARAIERWAAAGHRVDALVTTGDNVYDDGDPASFAAQLDQPYQALRRSRPLWVTLGNHDIAGGHAPEQLRHLRLPPLPYAKRLPGVELLFLDANRPDQQQADWLEIRLAAKGPAVRVVVFHQPAWSCGRHGSTAAVDRLWVPVLKRRRVALVLNGHDHDYQRFRSASGVTYVVSGGGGKGLYPVAARCVGTPARQAWAVRYHFTAVELRRGSLTLTAVADDGSVLDRAVLDRHRSPSGPAPTGGTG